jgi:hypothetical protein
MLRNRHLLDPHHSIIQFYHLSIRFQPWVDEDDADIVVFCLPYGLRLLSGLHPLADNGADLALVSR